MQQNPSGTFIVIEGTDGSGKGTQFNLLKARLEAVGHDVEVFDFPRYERESSYFVRQYLNGGFGKATTISPYTSSIFFALDRYEAAADIKKALAAGKIVMSNRYVGSNMAHQGAKFSDPAEQRGFFVWEDNLEFELLGIPRPTMNIFLKVPAETAYELIGKKAARSYTNKKRDEHEADIEHLRKSVETYELLCQLFPSDFKMIDCTSGGQLMSIPQINNKIWEAVQPLLPAKPAKTPKPMTVKLSEQASAGQSQKAEVVDKPAELEVSVPQACVVETLLCGLPIKAQTSDWAKNNYAFYTPQDMPAKLQAKYVEHVNQIADLHKNMRAKLKKAGADYEVLMPATPLAAMTQLKILATAEQMLEALRCLDASPSPKAALLAIELRRAIQKELMPRLKGVKNTEQRQEPEPINKIIARLASEQLPQSLGAQPETAELLDASPRNEFKALVDIIYPRSKLSRTELEEQIDSWDYKQKSEALQAALNQTDPQVLDKFRYLFDLTCDRQLIHEVIKSGIGFDIKVQPATPRFGYDVAEAVDQAEITDDFLACFDKSLELYSSLQAAGRDDLAPYATLLGHKNRFEMVCSLSSLKAGNLSPESGQKLLEEIKQKIAAKHPIVGESLTASKPEVKADPKPEPKSKKSRRNRRSGRKSKKS